MYRIAVLMLGATLAAAQTATPNPPPTPPQPAAPAIDPAVARLDAALQAGSSVKILLDKGVNSKGATVGQEITFRVVEGFMVGQTSVPKDSKMVAKVAQASARSKGDMDSILALEFTSAQAKDGQAQPIIALILAIAAPEQRERPVVDNIVLEPRSGSPTGARFDPNEKIGKDPEPTPGGPALGPKDAGSKLPGVELLHGLKDGQLLSALRSGDKSVKLESNTQLIVRVGAL